MKDRLQLKLKEALKAKDRDSMDAIRLLISAFQYEEMNKGVDALKEEEYTQILKREVKRRIEEKEFVEKAGKSDELTKLNKEIELIESFLPKQLSEDDLKRIITELKESSPDAQMGQIMKSLKEKYPNQYDAKRASEIVKESFS